MNTHKRTLKFSSMTALMQNEPKTDWASLFQSILHFKINPAIALAVVLFFAVSTGSVALIAYSELSLSDYQPLFSQGLKTSSRVLGMASYGYNQPVCGHKSANCLNHQLIGFNNNGWRVRIDYQLEAGIVGVIRVNGWPFMDNITGSGSGYTGYDLLPGKTYKFILYKKNSKRLIKLTDLNLTLPKAPIPEPQPQPEPTFCSQDAFQCPDGSYVGRSGPYCKFVCSTSPPSPQPVPPYGYAVVGIPQTQGSWTEGWIESIAYGSTQAPGSLKIYGWAEAQGAELKISMSLRNRDTGVEYQPTVIGVLPTRMDIANYLIQAAGASDPSAWHAKQNQFYAKFENLPAGYYFIYNARYNGNLFNVHAQAYQPIYISPIPQEAARVGEIILLNGTVMLVGQKGLYGFPDLATFNSWGFRFADILEPNQAERALPQIGVVPMKDQYCSSPLDQIEGRCPVSRQSVVQVISPNGGEKWEKGSTQTVKYQISSAIQAINVAVNISLTPYIACLHSEPACELAQPMPYLVGRNVISNGFYSFKVDKDLEGRDIPQGTFLVEVSLVSGGDSDSSDKPFAIYSNVPRPAIEFISPVGGEQWAAGSSQQIKWNVVAGVSAVDLYLDGVPSCSGSSIGGACSVRASEIIYRGAPNSGSFTWSVPNTSGNFTIRLEASSNGNIFSYNSNQFSIVSFPKPPFIQVVSPNGGEKIILGSQYAIVWDTNITPDSPVNIIINKSALGSGGSAYIARNAPNSGYYIWYTGNGILPLPYSMTQLNSGSDYTITIELSAGGVKDSSDGVFSLIDSQSQAYLQNARLSEQGLYKGQTYRIKWDSQGVDKVYLKLRKNSVGDTVRAISDTIVNNGYFDWTVPADLVDGYDYVVRVVGAGTNLYADSPVFGIKALSLAQNQTCLQVITRAKNSYTGEIKDFPNSCIPEGWIVVQPGAGTVQAINANSGIYRYIKIETPQSNSWVSWREIEIYDSGGQKITPISASASGSYSLSVPERSYDGNVNTAWISGSYNNSAIILDLGSDRQISKIRLLPANFPNPATATHYVRGKSAAGINFDPVTSFGPQIYDNVWLQYQQ